MAKSQAAILKTSWKATSVQRPLIVCQISPPYITRFTKSWVELLGMYLQRQTTPSSLFIIPLWIVFVRNGFASSTRTLRFFQPTIHPSDTTKMTSLYHFVLCILINRCLRSLSSSVMTTTMSTRMVSTNEVSTWPSYTFSFNLNAI